MIIYALYEKTYVTNQWFFDSFIKGLPIKVVHTFLVYSDLSLTPCQQVSTFG